MSRLVAAGRHYHHGQLREALLDAAAQLLEQQGTQFSLREVARQAGVSHAAPYHHFEDKHQLLEALAERCMKDFSQAQTAAAQASTPRARLIGLGTAYIEYAAAHPNAFQLIFNPELCRPGQTSVLTPYIQADHALLAEVLDQAIQAGDLPGHAPEALGTALWGTVHGLAHLVLLGQLNLRDVPAVLDSLFTPASAAPAPVH